MNNLTVKELSYINDLLTYELEASKKAELYSKTLTDQEIYQKFEVIEKNHKKRLKLILSLL